MKEFIDRTAENEGTPINRKAMMAIQGFIGSEITFEDDRILQRNADGEELTVVFSDDQTITETFMGEKTITKTISFDGSTIREVIL